VPEPVASTSLPTAPTLDDAFFVLCRALLAQLDDNMPERLHVQQVMGFYVDGNTTVWWAHAIAVLEGVVGTSLTTR
jgi:hypothetical protein